MKSIWANYLNNKNYETPSGSINRNVVVVGGGIAGICAAYNLSECGQKVTIVERASLLNGVTLNTTAHLTFIQGYNLADMYHKSIESARLYLESQQSGLDEIQQIIRRNNIDCDFKLVDGYIYTFENIEKLKDLYNVYKALNVQAEWIDNYYIMGYKVTAAIKLSNQGIFNPIKFANSLTMNIEIFENTPIIEIDTKRKIVYSKNASIKADIIVIATNFPIVNVPGYYFLRQYKSTSYAVNIADKHDVDAIYQSDEENGITIRGGEQGIIIGGLDHRTGRLDHNGKFDRLEEFANKYFNAKISHKWLANDCITCDSIPLVGALSKKRKDIYVITGFNKWGMLNSIVSGQLIADLICKIDNKYAKLLSPCRKKISIIYFIKNTCVTVGNLLIKPLNLFVPSYKSLQNNSGKIVWYKGKIKAVYKDTNGKFHICQSKCSHLKCKLQFNNQATSWDCPCHGSRFSIDGDIITAPAVRGIANEK